ncbi:MAG: SPOR domain-containing protein [Bacteroidales bacterium]
MKSRVITLIAAVAMTVFVGCKSKSYTSGNSGAYSDNAPYVGKPEVKEEETYTTDVYNIMPEKPNVEDSHPTISMEDIELAAKEEANTRTTTEDVEAVEDEMNFAGDNAFFVIVGSYSQIDNARREKQSFMSKGYDAVILRSNKNGYYRVSIGAYREKPRAYLLIGEIKNRYPQYSDSWVLIKE